MLRRVFLLLVFVQLASFAALAQSTPTVQFRVALKISGDSEIAAEIESCLKEELGLIKDVDLSDTKPDYTINAIAMVVQNKEQVAMGIAITWLSLYHPKGFFEDCSLIEDYRLVTLDKEDIQSNCRKFVERFNSKSLDPHRKVLQKNKP